MIQNLPEEIQEKAAVRRFVVGGSTHKDKKIQEQRMLRLEEKNLITEDMYLH